MGSGQVEYGMDTMGEYFYYYCMPRTVKWRMEYDTVTLEKGVE